MDDVIVAEIHAEATDGDVQMRDPSPPPPTRERGMPAELPDEIEQCPECHGEFPSSEGVLDV